VTAVIICRDTETVRVYVREREREKDKERKRGSNALRPDRLWCCDYGASRRETERETVREQERARHQR